MDELTAWLTLARAPGLHAGTLRPLLVALTSATQQLLQRAAATLHAAGAPAQADRGASARRTGRASAQICAGSNAIDHHFIPLDDERYPQLLAELPDAPIGSVCSRARFGTSRAAATRDRGLAQPDAGRPRERYRLCGAPRTLRIDDHERPRRRDRCRQPSGSARGRRGDDRGVRHRTRCRLPALKQVLAEAIAAARRAGQRIPARNARRSRATSRDAIESSAACRSACSSSRRLCAAVR